MIPGKSDVVPEGRANASVDFEQETYRKVAWRLTPILLLCYVIAYLDRVNVGFAKLQMARDLPLSDTVYGLGAGIFFLGYFIFEVPSNLILHRVGARIWISRIMITWGLVSALTMLVTGPLSFYLMRFLLGIAEAGFFPGVILYLTYWFPSKRRATTTAWLISAVALAGLFGGPLSGFILKTFDGLNAWHGWQWLFLIEGIPSILVGILVFVALDDRIADARWLTAREKALLAENLLADGVSVKERTTRAVFMDPRIWLICVIHFSLVMGLYGVGFWLPTLIRDVGVADPLRIGLLSAIPFGGAVVAMRLLATSSDRHRERRWHVAAPALCGAFGLVLTVAAGHNVPLAMAAITIATAGILSVLPLFWCLPTAFLGGTAAAAGIALINAIGNLAGFVSPYTVGWLTQRTGHSTTAMYMLAACLVAGALLTLCLPARLVNR